MKQEKSTTIRLITHAGAVLGVLCLPSTFRVIDLCQLKALGAARIEVLA